MRMWECFVLRINFSNCVTVARSGAIFTMFANSFDWFKTSAFCICSSLQISVRLGDFELGWEILYQNSVEQTSTWNSTWTWLSVFISDGKVIQNRDESIFFCRYSNKNYRIKASEELLLPVAIHKRWLIQTDEASQAHSTYDVWL